jgi:ribosome-associated toxin RatA of RatAB toxin-antitoxin module
MKFAVLTEADPRELAIPSYLESVERGHSYLQRELANGRVRDVFVRAGMAAGLWIVEAESLAEMQQLLQASPTAAYARYQTIALSEPDEMPAPTPPARADSIHFSDELRVAAAAERVYSLLWEVERWPQMLPHVKRIAVHSQNADYQDFEMETVGPAGAHVNRSTRWGSPHAAIRYEQTQPPRLFRVHRGVWTIEAGDGGVTVKSAHSIELEPAQIEPVLGRPYSPVEAAVLVRHFVGNHSTATLNVIKQLAEGGARE